MNLDGISKISRERLLDELKKILKPKSLKILSNNKQCLELIEIIFPQLKNFNIFKKLNSYSMNILEQDDFIFLISLLIIDQTDNAEYFLYKFNISKKNQQRIKSIDKFYREKINYKTFTKDNLNKIFYYSGKETLMDILNFKIFKSKKIDDQIIKLINFYKDKTKPTMPIKADVIMSKYNISEGKLLGNKLKIIENEWVKNNFQITDKEIENIVNN